VTVREAAAADDDPLSWHIPAEHRLLKHGLVVAIHPTPGTTADPLPRGRIAPATGRLVRDRCSATAAALNRGGQPQNIRDDP